MYVKHRVSGILIVSLYVYDLFVTASNEKMVKEFKYEIMQVFEMTGVMTGVRLKTYFLSLEIKQENGEMFIHQKKYVYEILKKFHMENCKSMSTPMNQKEKMMKEDEGAKIDENHFRSLVGCLVYLSTTKPDIHYVVSLLSCFMHCPSELHDCSEDSTKVYRRHNELWH